MRLSLETLARVRPHVARPPFDPRELKVGMVHLGLGAFHRAHQAVITEDAIAASGGDWGILGVSMRAPGVARALAAQDGLYAVAYLEDPALYRVVGSIRRTLTLPENPEGVIAAIAAPATQVVTLTVTEKGYCLAGEDLDLDHPDIVHDLARPDAPQSAVGVLAAGLARRRQPLTVVSCDNLARNGTRLAAAVTAFAERAHPGLAAWMAANAVFPETMVDCIVPASDAASRARVDAALGLDDRGSVQREPFAAWIIEDRFAGPRPAWEAAGAEIVADVSGHRALKLHVLNAVHSALACLGLPRGHILVREAMVDRELAAFIEGMVAEEVAPSLPDLPVLAYWAKTRARLANPAVDHRLEQIAEDGEHKLAERIVPLITANRRRGAPTARLEQVVSAQGALSRRDLAERHR